MPKAWHMEDAARRAPGRYCAFISASNIAGGVVENMPHCCVEAGPPAGAGDKEEGTSMMKSWFESAPRLVDTAMGRTPADTVIRNVRWVNVHSGEIIPGTDIAIAAGRFAFVGPDAAHTIGENTQVIDGGGRYAVPG